MNAGKDELQEDAGWLKRCSSRLIALLFERSERMLGLTFASLIVIGTILLWLPISHARSPISIVDALFTATSAVCVTGLIVVDTEKDFTLFGQTVIMVLFQAGGLGIMTFAALGAQILGGRMSFRSQFMVSDAFFQRHAATTLRRDLLRIVALTLTLEAIGAAVIYMDLRNTPGGSSALFSAVFHSISAFCNAGFSIYSDNLMARQGDYAMTVAILALVILGGLGHAVVLETARRSFNRLRRKPSSPHKWTLNTRIVLLMSGGLIVAGTVLLLPLGLADQSGGVLDGIIYAVFQSVTCRTAGFNTVDIGALPRTALLVMMVLMFIGGSPASCAGGVKTSSVATWYAQLAAWMRGRSDVTLLGRRLAPDVVARAAMIIGLAVIWCCTGWFVLAFLEPETEQMSELNLMFEQISAFSTVGLSTGLTPDLTATSKAWIILSMFVGRLGPLTAAMLISQRGVGTVRYPEERILVG